jgi:hypothetical protein
VAALGPAQTQRRVVVFDRGEGPFAGYRRREGSASVEDLPGLVEDLIRMGAKPSSTLDVTDALVCTDGARDRCCGSMGTRLWQAVEEGLDTVWIWRTSHTGGHRFAPTAITFPDSACWAYLDEALLRSVIDRSLSPLEAWSRLRGCTAFRPAVQAADGAVQAQRGWEWLSYARQGRERQTNRVELLFEAPNATRGRYDVELQPGRELPIPECSTDPAGAVKSQIELNVVRLHLESQA